MLDARLAEIDKRLHTIQSGLNQDDAPATRHSVTGGFRPVSSPPEREAVREPESLREPEPAAPVPEVGPAPIDRLAELTHAQERILASLQGLLDVLEGAALGPPGDPARLGPVSVSAGPFATPAALRRFEQALERLPEVRAVEVRGYEGTDRAIIDVHLVPTA